MQRNDRRQFLANVGSGMLVGSLGAALSGDLGISSAHAGEDNDRLTFGDMEPLVALMQETPLNRLQTVLIDRINGGTDLATLIAAGSLANARTFGGHDYVGFHTFMALTPALEMAAELPTERKALPDFESVVSQHRPNSAVRRIEQRSVEANRCQQARWRSRRPAKRCRRRLARLTSRVPSESWRRWLASRPRSCSIMFSIPSKTRPTFIASCWLGAHGRRSIWWASNMPTRCCRQSVQFCLRASESRIRDGRPDPELWTLLPKLLDQYKLLGKSLGDRQGDDEWIEELAWTFFQSDRRKRPTRPLRHWPADMRPIKSPKRCRSLPICCCCTTRVETKMVTATRSKGRVHGASVGVHASDAANAWRNIARVSNHRNTVASLLVGAYHTAGQSPHVQRERWPLKMDAVESIDDKDKLLSQANSAIRNRDQALAGAAIATLRRSRWFSRDRSSTCCWNLRPAKMVHCTPRSIIAR